MKSPVFFRRRSLLVVLALGAVIVAWLLSRPQAASTTARTDVAAVMELDAADLAVARGESVAATLTLAGVLQPLVESVLTAEVEGRIDAVLVRPGETVQAGQVLARMDTRDLAAQLAEQRANLAASRVQLDLAEKTQRRNEGLRERNFISASGLDASRGTLDANREALRAREAQLALARQALTKAVIRSPQAGIVAERAVQPGQHVAPNTRLFSIVDLAELEFAAGVPVAQVGAVRVGQNVSLVAEGADAAPAAGRVERIAPVADAATRMIPIYIRVANGGGRLRGGMAARGYLRLGEVANAVTLPREALRGSAGKPTVLVVAQGRAEMRDVQVGLVDEVSGRMEIKSGVQAGETAILARVGGIAPGQGVAEAKGAAAKVPAAPAR
jgi:membrane fusion protein, multidrug efflux system